MENLHELKDGALLKTLAADYEPFVLVTWDNKMPAAHAAELKHFGSTIAVINRSRLHLWADTEEHYIRNAVHRWLHRMESQDAATTALYSTDGIARPHP